MIRNLFGLMKKLLLGLRMESENEDKDRGDADSSNHLDGSNLGSRGVGKVYSMDSIVPHCLSFDQKKNGWLFRLREKRTLLLMESRKRRGRKSSKKTIDPLESLLKNASPTQRKLMGLV